MTLGNNGCGNHIAYHFILVCSTVWLSLHSRACVTNMWHSVITLRAPCALFTNILFHLKLFTIREPISSAQTELFFYSFLPGTRSSKDQLHQSTRITKTDLFYTLTLSWFKFRYQSYLTPLKFFLSLKTCRMSSHPDDRSPPRKRQRRPRNAAQELIPDEEIWEDEENHSRALLNEPEYRRPSAREQPAIPSLDRPPVRSQTSTRGEGNDERQALRLQAQEWAGNDTNVNVQAPR